MRIYKWLLISALLLLLVACQEEATLEDVPDEKEPSTEEMTSFRVASWSQEISEQTNLLVADEKPFFKDEQIDLTFIPGAGGGDAIKNVLAGNADIAFTDAGSLFSALDQGEDLVAIYNIYPQNVFNVVALKENNITKPDDLKGKTVGVYSLSSGTRQNLLILLHEAGLTEDDVEIVETGLLNFAPLMQKQVDATAATDTGLFLGKEKGLEDVDVMEVKDYLNFSSDLFVVTRDMFEEQEEALVRFLEAYKASAQWMIDEPDEAAALAVDYAIDGQDEAVNKEIIELRNAASQSDDPLGYIDVEQLQDAADTYKSLGLIENELDMDKHIINILNE
ncbi:MAG TPA: ABC transporter substrate-binding protein [Pseudogracilibacillus sp.]|nr:ABC transporter substrate-binding protein [Pseudogracilibacillus sp.]